MMAIRPRTYVEIKAKASRCFTDYPFVTKSKTQFPAFGVMGTMVGPLPILATKGLSATATELRARLILEPARRARRRQGRSALGTEAPGRRVLGHAARAAHRVFPVREM